MQADALEWATVLIPGDQDAHDGRAVSHLVRTKLFKWGGEECCLLKIFNFFFYHSLQIRRWWLYKSVERFFSLSSNFLSVGNGPPCGWILRYLIRVTFNSNNRRKKLEAACDDNFCMKHISFKKSIGICPDFQKDIPKLTWNVKDLFKMLGADWSLIRRVAGFSKTWLATLHMSA